MSVLTRFRSDDRGVAMVLFALSLLPISVAAGAAVDYTRAAQTKTTLQSELDSAVLVGAGKNADKGAAAEAMLDAFATPAGTEIVSKSFSQDGNQLKGTVTAEVSTVMMRIVNVPTIEVSVTSTAELVETRAEVQGPDTVIPGQDQTTTTRGAPVCILVKNPTASQALLVNSGVKITAPTCEIHVRSTANTAAMMNDTRNINVRRVCIKSTSITQNGYQNPRINQNCPAIDDPYAGTLPTVALPNNNCSTRNGGSYDANSSGRNLVLQSGNYCGLNFNSGFTSVTLSSGNYRQLNLGGAETFNLNPGMYENININSGIRTVNFAPGLYIWKGNTNFNSGIKFSGTGVTFYYPDNGSYIQFNDRVEANFTAPTSGPYAGILFFEKTGLNSSSFSVNGNASQHFEGLIYWPSRHVTFNSTSNVTADKVSIVVDKLTLNNTNWKLEPSEERLRNPDETETVKGEDQVVPGKTETRSAYSVRLVE
jgi:Flp pilus assembly protein TadG